MLKSLKDFSFSGLDALREVISQSEYKTLHQAVASLAVFSHPETVKQTQGKNLFRVIRARGEFKRRDYSEMGNVQVMHDDNWSPKRAFAWANNVTIKSKKDVQYNHVVSKSDDVRFYTSLANLVALPAFLSKLTDTHPEIRELLRYRSQELYGPCLGQVTKPLDYDQLSWADTLPSVIDVEAGMRHRMKTCPRDRTVVSAREIGWLFSNFEPDKNL